MLDGLKQHWNFFNLARTFCETIYKYFFKNNTGPNYEYEKRMARKVYATALREEALRLGTILSLPEYLSESDISEAEIVIKNRYLEKNYIANREDLSLMLIFQEYLPISKLILS